MKWTPKEEEALRAGVAKHGNGRWKKILSDGEFASSLLHRSNVDLKDKWRNMICGISRKSRSPRVKETSAIPHSNVQNAALAVTLSVDDVLHKSADEKAVLWYYDMMIFKVLSTIKDSNGLDFGTIISRIELQQKQEVPLYLRRLLSSKLGRLVMQGRVSKVKNRYKINDGYLGMRTPSPKQKDIRPKSLHNSTIEISSKIIEDVASKAALLIMDAENKSILAAEAVEESERVSKMNEDAEAMLDLAKQIYQHCSRGELALIA